MEGSSFVSRARTAFHSAAAKAERVIVDFKSDFAPPDHLDEENREDVVNRSRDELCKVRDSKDSNETKQFRWRPPSIGTKLEWHERLKNIGRGRKDTKGIERAESPKMSFPIFDENLYLYDDRIGSETKFQASVFPSPERSDENNRDIIPPATVLKQLAIAVESGNNYKSIKDLLASSRNSSPVRERASLGISAVKSLMRRGKEERMTSDFTEDEVFSFIQSVLDAEGLTPGRKIGFSMETLPETASLTSDIHAGPPESFVARISEVVGSFKTMRKMALFWCRVVAELRRLWLEEQYIPGIPIDGVPDLNCCLLYQQMQVMNCCVSRKQRRAIATELLEALEREAGGISDLLSASRPLSSALYARLNSGELVLRLGVDHPADDLTMLETGEPIYAPVTQEGPLLTEDYIRENEEFVLRTGSVGAGCSQLLSDMQAFKAANPGCVLEDFVRWHSPPDWTEVDSYNETDDTSSGGDSTSMRGQLSTRMRKEGNLWRELWETAKQVPAVRQAPLFDEDLAVEGILTFLEDIPPSELFEQLFRSLLALGFIIAETQLPMDENVVKLFYECKDYVIATCQGASWTEKIDDICQVYETIEAMFVRPEEVLKMMQQPEEMTNNEEPKGRFKRLSLIFGGKNRSTKKSASKEQNNLEDSPSRQPFANFFDSKSSLFSKKPPKPESTTPGDKPLVPLQNGWTVV